jgi:hypothetical protein
MSAHVTLLACQSCGQRYFLRMGESAPPHQHMWTLVGSAKLDEPLDGSVS